MKILITDIDEVLLAWSKSFDKFIRENYEYTGIYIAESGQRLWELIDVPKEIIGEVMSEHTCLPSFGHLDYHNDAEVLNHNKDTFDKIIAITSCGNESHIMEARNNNIAEKFPDTIDEIIYLDYLEEKIQTIEKLISENPEAEFYMIDDSVLDIEKAIELGVKGYVYKTTFHDSKDLPTVDSLSEFFRVIV